MIDSYRAEIEQALAAGATKADIARTLGIPRATLHSALDRWALPEKERPGEEALAELRRLVSGG